MSERNVAAERREFIREHASRLDAARVAALAHTDGVMMSADTCWRLARELWDAKPEDC